jgi:hypothetical protein
MSKFFSMFAALVALLAATTFAQAAVGICPQSDASGLSGIGDGCSLPSGSATVFPGLGAFKDNFTQSCEWHDKCYTTIGTTYAQCDGDFLSNMKGACADSYPVYLVPDVYYSCIATAGTYYAAVVVNGQVNNPLPDYQYNAYTRSVAMENEIRLNHCATTLASTTLFDNSLVTQVNSAWQTYAHRQPTLYEFFDVVDNGPNVVYNRADWNTFLLQKAAGAAAYIPPVVNAPTRSGNVTLTANPIVANVQYVWDLNGAQSDLTSASTVAYDPKYNTTYTLTGFVTATSPQYAKTFPITDADLLTIPPGARNVAIFSMTYTESGWCGPSPKQYCL